MRQHAAAGVRGGARRSGALAACALASTHGRRHGAGTRAAPQPAQQRKHPAPAAPRHAGGRGPPPAAAAGTGALGGGGGAPRPPAAASPVFNAGFLRVVLPTALALMARRARAGAGAPPCLARQRARRAPGRRRRPPTPPALSPWPCLAPHPPRCATWTASA